MAVEAHHLHPLIPPQLLNLKNRDLFMGAAAADNQPAVFHPQMTALLPPPAAASAAAPAPFYNPAATASDSGLTVNNNNNNINISAAAVASRKRARESASLLGDDVASHVQQQMLDIDRLVVHHAEKVRMELMERRRRFSRQILAAVEEGVSKRLRAKEEEIERIGKLNWALEERIKSLGVENQIWRYLAQTNEAAAHALRTNLERVLADQAVKVKEEQRSVAGEAAPPPAEDAESCCCGDNYREGDDGEEAAPVMVPARRMCRNCNHQEPSVLLLPCRHLCLCSACAPAADHCPICNFGRTGSVNVNLS